MVLLSKIEIRRISITIKNSLLEFFTPPITATSKSHDFGGFSNFLEKLETSLHKTSHRTCLKPVFSNTVKENLVKKFLEIKPSQWRLGRNCSARCQQLVDANSVGAAVCCTLLPNYPSLYWILHNYYFHTYFLIYFHIIILSVI